MTKSSISLFFILLTVTSASSSEHIHRITAHEDLTTYGFPIGLLPTDIRNYSINRTSGEFSVNLGNLCKITLSPANHLATYSRTITGRIFNRRIVEIDGIRVWAYFKWWSISGIRLSGDDLVFNVGRTTIKYPLKNFDEPPACDGRKSDS